MPVSYERGHDGVAVLTLDAPGQSANTMSRAYAKAMTAALDRLEAERDTLTGVIVTSAKSTFFAGGDLPEMIKATPADAPALTELLTTVKRDLRRLETLGVPVVAALNGSALGGGLEIALACHHRIALDVPESRFGFPEVTLGLLPGAGGVTRTVRMFGLRKALESFLLSGKQLRPADALDAGLVDEVVATPGAMLDRARDWIAAHPDAVQPWGEPRPEKQLLAYPAVLRQRLKGNRLPAPEAILAAAVEGLQVDLDTALDIETRYLVSLLTGQIAKNMIGAFFFDLRAVNGGASRPAVEVPPARRVAVLGAGMMGAGIAHACARAGLDVVVRDVTEEAAARAATHPRITTTADLADLEGCDVVIEAVFEDIALKRKVFADVEPLLKDGALLASNTSTLPITELAGGVTRPGDFIGMHFFSPVAKMPLLEIVVGAETGDAALARAFDLARRIRKTPIVVNDGRGFFTSRVIGKYIDEAIGMLAEGVPAPSIERAALAAGYPTGPLALADEVSLSLLRHIRGQYETADPTFTVLPSHAVIDTLLTTHDRPGRAAGRGFYDYVDGRRARLWSGLAEMAGGDRVPFEDLQDRMLFAESLDALRCLDEGVLRSEADGDIGSLLGIGFPAWTGGAIRFARQHADFAGRARALAGRYGDRFSPEVLPVT
ncbi:3-hydroxyacyl-CoA dehydrogenase NAD-binding domain-containing protein [Winogradskya consettensis]|uniref:3-hydroxyacyl-CoA dehydrogenase n=1 Tax=Winogradskya consettensis TaxID=113560 RepID=A0A919VUX4_9ACTN|nr:3-hydroxyacyl-CoA dehydrogenase NAD-binding domain-containing protein [Actinoplanes consettensis]GIM70333.1 3-hydroxyacyl-CoA dehydrogenase [Actinoplanes consettensis]